MNDTLGKYKIESELGQGAFAIVYRASDTSLNRPVALKVLRPVLLADPDFTRDFLREAKTMARLRHPHIVTVYEVGQTDGQLFIAMDMADGGSLDEALTARGPLTFPDMLAILKPVCSALDYAHAQNIIHRDLKPENILLDKTQGPMLTDFGFARLMSENSMSLSISGGIVGTPAYIAPEVWDSDNALHPPADIYALGCIVYEMLTGQLLFKGKTPMRTIAAHANGAQFNPDELQHCPTGTVDVLADAVAQNPTQRIQSAGDLLTALEDLSASKPMPVPKVISNTKTRKPTSTRSIWLWVALVTAVIIIAGITIISQRDWLSPPSNMVLVPAGEFIMGSNSGSADEQPVHTVYLDGFYIDKYEVTNAQFAQFLDKMGNQSEENVTWFDVSDKDALIHQIANVWKVNEGFENHPAIEMSWYGANAYCQWLGKSLPTEAQWEKAARGTDGRTYPWGEGIDCNKAQYNACNGQTVPVGTKIGISPYGAYDMAGNVLEWVNDWYDENYYAIPNKSNPTGLNFGYTRVTRGGAWTGNALAQTTTRRSDNAADFSSHLIGFRCVKPALN